MGRTDEVRRSTATVTHRTRGTVQGGGPPEIGNRTTEAKDWSGRSTLVIRKERAGGVPRLKPNIRRVSVPKKPDGHVAEAGNLPALVSPEVSPVAEAGTPPIPMHACLWS